MRPAVRICATAALAVMAVLSAARAQGAPEAPAAPATTAKPDPVGCEPPQDGRAGLLADDALDALLARLPQCQDRADWLAAVGHLLNRARRHGEAADVIERALLLDPGHKGARVDYAVALAGSGDTLAARALLADILAEPDVPAGLRAVLLHQRSTLEPLLVGGWHLSGWVGLRLGHDSNLFGAPDIDSLTLTLGGQLVELALDDSYLARPGSYRQVEAALALLYITPEGARWQAGLSLRDRSVPSAPEADGRYGEALFEYGAPLPGDSGLRGYAGVAAAALRSGLTDYTTRTLNLGLEPVWAAGCETRIGLEVQSRDYSSNPVLSGRYSGITYGRFCDTDSGKGRAPGQTLWSARLGRDRPVQSERPGGAQRQAAVRWATSQPHALLQPGVAGHWLLDTELAAQHDDNGYSPILDSGRSRTIKRLAARLEFRRPVLAWPGGYLEPAIGVDYVHQRSNIPLFGLTNWGPYATLRARW